MARTKLDDDKKKPKISITINEKLSCVMEEHLEKLGLNRSKYIENLIREDFEKRGLNILPNFEK